MKTIMLNMILLSLLWLSACGVSQSQLKPEPLDTFSDWTIELTSGGGIAGTGNENSNGVITSKGKVVARIPRGSTCERQPADKDLRELDRLIKAINFAKWQADYSDPDTLCRDHLGYSMSLKTQSTNGAPSIERGSVVWSDCPKMEVPKEILDVHQAASKIIYEANLSCYKAHKDSSSQQRRSRRHD